MKVPELMDMGGKDQLLFDPLFARNIPYSLTVPLAEHPDMLGLPPKQPPESKPPLTFSTGAGCQPGRLDAVDPDLIDLAVSLG